MTDEDLPKDGTTEDLPRESKKAIVTKLVIVPMLIVAVALSIFLFFGWLTYDRKSAEEFVADIKTASMSKKWQAAFVLAGKLRAKEGIKNPDRLYQEMVSIFENREHYDERVRSYMAMALGNLGDPRAVGVLENAVRSDHGDVPIYAMWGLGTLQAKSSIPLLTDMAKSADDAVRKTALFVLGSFGDPATVSLLRASLADPEVDIQWNAALALARMGDASGVHLISKLLDRNYYRNFPDMTAQDQSDAIINALRAAALLKDSSFRSAIEKLSREDINAQVRHAAHEVLNALEVSYTQHGHKL